MMTNSLTASTYTTTSTIEAAPAKPLIPVPLSELIADLQAGGPDRVRRWLLIGE